MTPKISICMPTYNRADSLRIAIAAMRSQTVTDWELIIGDDASTDHTRQVVGEFNDSRIHYHRNDANLGIYENWNRLLTMARGPYVAIYHDHDIYLPTILERSCAVLDRHPGVSFVHTAMMLIDREGTPLDLFIQGFDELTPGDEFQEKMLDFNACLTAATALVRRSAYETVGRYRPEFGLGADRDMWLRLAGQGDVGYVREPQALILGRGPEDATSAFRWEDVQGAYQICDAWISSLYPAGSRQRRWAETRLAQQWDGNLMRLAVKTAAFEGPEVVRQRTAMFRPYAGRLTALVLGALGGSGLVRSAIRGPAARWHLHSLERRKAAAAAYCQTHSHIAAYLPHAEGETANVS